MTETPESAGPTAEAPPAVKPTRLYQIAAWVVIVAGITFIVSAIFFTGVYIGQGGWSGRHHQHGPCMMHHGPMGPGPDFGPEFIFPPPPGPGGPAGPGNGPAGPGNGPGGPGAPGGPEHGPGTPPPPPHH